MWYIFTSRNISAPPFAPGPHQAAQGAGWGLFKVMFNFPLLDPPEISFFFLAECFYFEPVEAIPKYMEMRMVDWELDITGICPTNFPINIGIYSRRYVNMRICIYAIAAGMTQCRREAAGIFPITAGDEFYVLLPFIWKHMFVCIYIYIIMYYII